MQWLSYINWASSIFFVRMFNLINKSENRQDSDNYLWRISMSKVWWAMPLIIMSPWLGTHYHDLCPCGTYGAVETLWVEVIAHSLHPVIPGLDGKVAPLAHGLEHLPPVYNNRKYTEDWKVISMCHTYM